MDDDKFATALAATNQAIHRLTTEVCNGRAANLAQSYVLFELARDLASRHGDRERYVAELYERVCGRADRTPLEQERTPFVMAFRAELERFFGVLMKSAACEAARPGL